MSDWRLLGRAGLLVLVASVASSVVADPAQQEAPALKALMDRNRSMNGYVMDEAGHCEALWGDLSDAATGGPQETAKAFLSANGKLLGAPDGSDWQKDLALVSSASSELGSTLVFAPAIAGVPYLQAALRLQFTATGRLAGATGTYRMPSPVTAATIDATRAIQTARAQFADALTGDGTVEEVLEARAEGGVRACFRVHLVVGSPPRQWTVLVGPAGEILQPPVDTSLSDVPDGLVGDGYPLQALGIKDLPDINKPANSRVLWTLDGKHFKSESSYPIKARSRSGHFDYPPLTPLGIFPVISYAFPPFLETSAYYQFCKGRDLALKWGAVELDDHKLKYDVWMPPAWGNWFSFNNAYFTSADWSIHFASTDIIPPLNPSQDNSVILHEFGHSVESSVNPWWYGGQNDDERHETQSVAEGFADFFSASALNNSMIGIAFLIFRNCENDHTYAKHVHDEMHEAGKIFSGLCWDIRGKLGRDDAARLIIAGVRAAQSPVTFHRAAAGILVADASLYHGSHLADIKEILTRRGVYP